jgi:hypothetical protein
MTTFDEDTSKNTATRRGSGGDLQSKALHIPNAGADDAPQQTGDEHQPEASDQETTEDS